MKLGNCFSKFVNQSSSFPELFLDLTMTEPEPEFFSAVPSFFPPCNHHHHHLFLQHHHHLLLAIIIITITIFFLQYHHFFLLAIIIITISGIIFSSLQSSSSPSPCNHHHHHLFSLASPIIFFWQGPLDNSPCKNIDNLQCFRNQHNPWTPFLFHSSFIIIRPQAFLSRSDEHWSSLSSPCKHHHHHHHHHPSAALPFTGR